MTSVCESGLRICFLVAEDPLQPFGGSALRNWQNILACSRLGSVFVACIAPAEPRTVHPTDRILVRYYGSENAWVLSDKSLTRLNPLLQRTYKAFSKPVGGAFLGRKVRRDLRSFRPGIIIFEEYKCAVLTTSVADLPAAVVYDAHNVETVLQKSLAMSGFGLLKNARAIWDAVAGRELSLVDIADQIWVCSDAEKAHAAGAFRPCPGIRVIPNTIDTSRYANAYRANHGSDTGLAPGLVFCASFNYVPNRRAAETLIEDIFPRIAGAFPEARLTLVGRNPTDQMLRAASLDSRIVVTGCVADPAEFLAGNQICLVPLREGGGTRLKILEAFASGCAVVSTRKGAEGLRVVDGRHLLLAESPDAFADAALHLWRDADHRREMISCARELVLSRYSPDCARRRIESAIRDLVAERCSAAGRAN